MKNILYFDAYDDVRCAETGGTLFSTIDMGTSEIISEEVIIPIIEKFNSNNSLVEMDKLLMNEENISQDQREIILESMYDFMNN